MTFRKLLVLVALWLTTPAWLAPQPTRIIVVGPGGYARLELALLHAASGDTIAVKPGVYVYTGNVFGVVVDKPVAISCDAGAVFDGQHDAKRFMRISANGVTVSGCEIRNFTRVAVDVQANDATIDSVYIHDMKWTDIPGAYDLNSAAIILHDPNLDNVSDCSRLTVTRSRIENIQTEGMHLGWVIDFVPKSVPIPAACPGAVVRGNTFKNVREGLDLKRGMRDGLYADNRIDRATLGAIVQDTGNTFERNVVSNVSYSAFRSNLGGAFAGNDIRGVGMSGISVLGGSASVISNTIASAKTPLNIAAGVECTIGGNAITLSGESIGVSKCVVLDATPTPTATRTRTPTRTSTPSATATPTATATATPAWRVWADRNGNNAIDATDIAVAATYYAGNLGALRYTYTPTRTPTHTPTHTPTRTPTRTAAPTQTQTATVTPMLTPTLTPSDTATQPPSPLATPTDTLAPSPLEVPGAQAITEQPDGAMPVWFVALGGLGLLALAGLALLALIGLVEAARSSRKSGER